MQKEGIIKGKDDAKRDYTKVGMVQEKGIIKGRDDAGALQRGRMVHADITNRRDCEEGIHYKRKG